MDGEGSHLHNTHLGGLELKGTPVDHLLPWASLFEGRPRAFWLVQHRIARRPRAAAVAATITADVVEEDLCVEGRVAFG